ncbi:MAG: S41 family peptidase [Bacteroidaceae bacterium]|nr:S41 family peptidase [Bacteroidaceae bacterium]
MKRFYGSAVLRSCGFTVLRFCGLAVLRSCGSAVLRFCSVLWFAILSQTFTSCIKGEDTTNTKQNNFEALWKLMDEHYCFFDYKQQAIGLDWNAVHAKYAPQISEEMTNQQLFEVMTHALAELQDGHVNLGTAFDYARNWRYYEDYPHNYNDSIIYATYLGTDYRITSGLFYQILSDNIGYIRVPTFSLEIGHGNISTCLKELALCTGLIIDIRNNGGGKITSAQTLASHFINHTTLIGYSSHKTGPGHSDLSQPKAQYLDPASDGIRWQKPCVLLTNRQSYSAANDFVKCMKTSPVVTVMGDKTGGGSGMPFSSELPNGWSVRYSAVIYYDHDMQHTEFGIQPDIPLQMSGTDTGKLKDTYIEKAREFLKEQ